MVPGEYECVFMALLPLAGISFPIVCARIDPSCGQVASTVLLSIITEHAAHLPLDCGEGIAQGKKGCGFPVVATRETPSLRRLSVRAYTGSSGAHSSPQK